MNASATGKIKFSFKHSEKNIYKEDLLTEEEQDKNLRENVIETLKDLFDEIELLEVEYEVIIDS